MKLNRQRLNGATHKGDRRYVPVKWLVTASSSTDAQAASPIHSSFGQPGRGCVLFGDELNRIDALAALPRRQRAHYREYGKR